MKDTDKKPLTEDGYTIESKTRLGIEHWKQVSLYLIIYDAVAVTLAYFLALLLRFDFRFSMIPEVYFMPWLYFAPFYIFICLAVFSRFRLYRSIWRFASFTELNRITQATILTGVLHIIGVSIALNIFVKGSGYTMNRMPVSYYLGGALIQFVLITGIRFSYRFVLLLRASRDHKGSSRVMLVGAGSAGQMILRDIRRSEEIREEVVCIIDDNKNKWNRDVDGVPVVGAKCILGTTLEMPEKSTHSATPQIVNNSKKYFQRLFNAY